MFSAAFSALFEYLRILWDGLGDLLFEATLPFTKYIFSKKPTPPAIQIKDKRCSAFRFKLQAKPSSVFNVDSYEIQKAELGSKAADEWETCYVDEGLHPTVAGLKPSQGYAFRARASNVWGESPWSPVIRTATLARPVNGGGLGPNYLWTQTASEVTLDFQLSDVPDLRARQVEVRLKAQQLSVTVSLPQGLASVISGEIPHQAKPLGEGSFWELLKSDGMTHLVITLEKSTAYQRPPYGPQGSTAGLWRCAVKGHGEIDIYRISDI